MAGFRELEGPEIGSPPMSSEWPDGMLAEHWDVHQDEATRVAKRSADVRDHVSRVTEVSPWLRSIAGTECRQARLNLREAMPMRYAPRPYNGFLGDAGRKSHEYSAARKDGEWESGRRVRRAGGRRRVRRPLPARSPAQARLQRKGIRGRVRHRRHLVLELLSGRPGRLVRAAVSVFQRGALAGLELPRALSLVGGASRLFPPRRQEARSQP